MGDDVSDDNFTVLGRNGSYFLTEDAEGYGIWPVRSDREDPVLTFPSGANGRLDAEAAFRRETRFARSGQALMVASIVAGATWVLSTVAAQILDWSVLQQRLFTTSARQWQPSDIARILSAVAYVVFVVSVGLFVVLWLHRRYRREG